MKAKEIRNSDRSSIEEKVLEMKKELVKINSQVATGSAIKNPGQIRKIKKNLARILTIKNEKKKTIKEPEKPVKKEVGKKA